MHYGRYGAKKITSVMHYGRHEICSITSVMHYGRITDALRTLCHRRIVRYCAKYMRCNGFKLGMMVKFHASKVSPFFQPIWTITTRAIMI